MENKHHWKVWWQGSGPQRGDHVMCGREEIAYLGDQNHDAVGELVRRHNAAIDALSPIGPDYCLVCMNWEAHCECCAAPDNATEKPAPTGESDHA